MRPDAQVFRSHWRSLVWIVATLGLLAATSCNRTAGLRTNVAAEQTTAASESIDAIAGDYLRLALALGERDPDSVDYAIAPPLLKASVHRAYPSLDEIDRESTRLLTGLGAFGKRQTDFQRIHFLTLQLRAIRTRTAMLRGHLLDFDSEAQALFDTVRLPDVESAHRAAVLRETSMLLPPRKSYAYAAADLASRYAAFDRQFIVPPAKIDAVMQAALAGCRRQTIQYIRLPPAESVQLTFVRNKPWSAFSRYEGNAQSTISLNLDLPLTVDGALDLACHEGYPGHHVFNTLHDAALVGRDHRPEAQVQLTFSPESYVSEAAASYAPHLAFPEDERIVFERDVLFPLAGLDPRGAARHVRLSRLLRELASAQPAIARDYLDGRLEFIHAEDELARQTLMLHAEATLLYLNEYRSYMLAYTDGPRRVERYLHEGASGKDEDRERARRVAWDRFVQMAQTGHAMFGSVP